MLSLRLLQQQKSLLQNAHARGSSCPVPRILTLLRPVSTEINGEFCDFSRLIIDIWIIDDCLNVIHDDNHMRKEKERTSEKKPLFLRQVLHLLSS